MSELYNRKRKLLEFEGEWLEHIGRPEPCKSWLIWGDSSNGKTTYVLKLAKYLSRFGKVLYNSLEEGDSESIKNAFKRVGMEEVGRRVVLLDNEPMDELEQRLAKRGSPRIVIIDTVQYADITYKRYKELREKFDKVLWIYVSHEEGKLPDGKVANKIRRDAMVKVRVQGFKAFPTSRYGGIEPYIVWEEGANKFWAKGIE